MKYLLIILLVTSCLLSCKNPSPNKQIQEETEMVPPPIENEVPATAKDTNYIDLESIPDSLELIPKMDITADFNGDDIQDYCSMVRNTETDEIGIVFLHNEPTKSFYVFGAGKELDGKTDLKWAQTIETVPKGEVVAPTLVDEVTGDILGPDESKNFRLIAAGVELGVEESHGGKLFFWDGNKYQWYHKE